MALYKAEIISIRYAKMSGNGIAIYDNDRQTESIAVTYKPYIRDNVKQNIPVERKISKAKKRLPLNTELIPSYTNQIS